MYRKGPSKAYRPNYGLQKTDNAGEECMEMAPYDHLGQGILAKSYLSPRVDEAKVFRGADDLHYAVRPRVPDVLLEQFRQLG